MLSHFRKCFSRVYSTSSRHSDVVVIGAARTPIGSFGGSLSTLSATQLGRAVVEAVVRNPGLDPSIVESVILGNVCQANLGQSPARQVQLAAGIPNHVDATTINKVCASGLKSIIYGVQSIQLGQFDVVVAGGFESMSNVPYYLEKARFNGFRFGNQKLIDGLVRDGLSDAFDHYPMGLASDETARSFNITREDQDKYALLSYSRAQEATKKGLFRDEIIPISVPSVKRQEPSRTIIEDEESGRLVPEKVHKLRAEFSENGTATAANSSKISDGASALLLMSARKASELNLKPLAQILGHADGATRPIDFTIAPSISLSNALKMVGLDVCDIDLWEINEAFCTVPLANSKRLEIPIDRLNVHGGAVALGHPIGASGCRIVATLIHSLSQTGGNYGAAAICNGGGGSSSIIIKRL